MKDFKKERGRGRQYLKMGGGLVVLGVLVLVAAGSAQAAWGMYQKFLDASAANAAAQAELATLEAQHATVSATVEGLTTERGLEAAVRQRYGMGHPGEGEIDIVRQPADPAGASAEPQGFWARLWAAVVIW